MNNFLASSNSSLVESGGKMAALGINFDLGEGLEPSSVLRTLTGVEVVGGEGELAALFSPVRPETGPDRKAVTWLDQLEPDWPNSRGWTYL